MKNNKNDNLPRIFFVGQYPGVFNKIKSPYKSETYSSEWNDRSFFGENGGNRGNLVWQESVFRIFSYDTLNSRTGSFKELYENRKNIDDEFDFIILNMACWINDRLFQPHSFFNSTLKFKKCKVISLGNGCENNQYLNSNPNLSKSFFHPSVLETLKWISDNVEIFSVRGESTKQTLKEILNIDSVALGCPSAYAFPNSINNISLPSFEDSILATASYLNPNSPHLKVFNQFKSTNYFSQSYFGFDSPSNIEFPPGTNISDIVDVKINEANGEVLNYPFKIDGIDKIYASNDVDNWRGVLSMHDYYIGSRIHCSILSLQAGIFPFIYYDDERPLEIASLIGMPHLNSKIHDSYKLDEIFNEANLNFFKQKYLKQFNLFKKTMNASGLSLR